VTVVTGVYNTMPCLTGTLPSLVAQSIALDQLEVVAVDGSTDGSTDPARPPGVRPGPAVTMANTNLYRRELLDPTRARLLGGLRTGRGSGAAGARVTVWDPMCCAAGLDARGRRAAGRDRRVSPAGGSLAGSSSTDIPDDLPDKRAAGPLAP
jgi:hypothetical protein